MNTQNLFDCEAFYRGSKIVNGIVSPSLLNSVADYLFRTDESLQYGTLSHKFSRGDRCHLHIDEDRLKISSIKKDEGFESDTDSSASSDTSCGERNFANHDIKVIDDHVLRLERLIRQDSGIQTEYSQGADEAGPYSSLSGSSSGAESEEESSQKDQSISISDSENKIVPENGVADNILMSDILFCHVPSQRPKVVVIVVKSVENAIVQAHIFECLTHEAARTLYSNYHLSSNKYKLNRYKNNKRRNDAPIDPEDKATLDRIHVSIRNIKRKSDNLNDLHNNQNTATPPPGENQSKSFLFGEYQSEILNKKDNVNIIEIREPDLHHNSFPITPRIDSNGVTHIEIESAPPSLVVPTPISRQKKKKLAYEPNEILSALDRLSLHSSSHPDSYLNTVGVSDSCPTSLITATSRESISERKSRQRHPPMFLKDETVRTGSLARKDIKKRTERRNRSKSEERRDDRNDFGAFDYYKNRASNNAIFLTPKNLKHSQSEEVTTSQRLLQTREMHLRERQSRSRNIRSSDQKERRLSHNKRPAPAPPPRRHPNNPSLLLVPTKSGHEITKSFYPKETHITSGQKLIRIDYPLYPPWNMNADINNNPQRIYYSSSGGWLSSHEFHGSRVSDMAISNEMRKRSRSKSPARRPTSHRYMDAMASLNLPQKLKDLSDSVKQSLKSSSQSSPAQLNSIRDNFGRNSARKSAKGFEVTKDNDCLKPVIKRGKKNNSRRVTFNAYATVQMMDP